MSRLVLLALAVGLLPVTVALAQEDALTRCTQLQREKKFVEAGKACEEAIRSSPKSAAAWTAKAGVHLDLEDLAKSRESADKALALDPNAHRALYFRALAQVTSKPEAAARDIDAAIVLAPMEYEYLQWAGAMAQAHGHLDKAMGLLDRALAVKPDDLYAMKLRAEILAARKEVPAALAAYDRILSLDPRDVDTLHRRGHLHENQGAIVKAEADFAAAVALSPQSEHLWADLGNTRMVAKRPKDAIAAYDKALALDPKLRDALLGRAVARLSTGEPLGSLHDFSRAGVPEDPSLRAGVEEMREHVQTLVDREFCSAEQPGSSIPDVPDRYPESCTRELTKDAEGINEKPLRDCLATAYEKEKRAAKLLLQSQPILTAALANKCEALPDAKSFCAALQQRHAKKVKAFEALLLKMETPGAKRAHEAMVDDHVKSVVVFWLSEQKDEDVSDE